MSDFTTLPSAIANAVRLRTHSACDIAEAFRSHRPAEPAVNAARTLIQALADDACDRRLAAGQPARLLEGVPFRSRTTDTKGLRTTFVASMENNVPARLLCVERLATRAVLLGKANTPEFAHDVKHQQLPFGTTRNRGT